MPVYQLRGLVVKTVGIVNLRERSRRAIASAAFIFVSIARSDRAGSDLDLLVLGDDLAYADVYTALQGAGSPHGQSAEGDEPANELPAPATPSLRGWPAQPKLFVIGSEMPSAELERLAGTGQLKREPPIARVRRLDPSAAARLADAKKTSLSAGSRFDLAYNAAHALALAALRWHGYRADKRYLVFQALAHTLGTPPSTWRLLAKCHQERNQVEYEGLGDVDQALLAGLLEAASLLLDQVCALSLPSVPEV